MLCRNGQKTEHTGTDIKAGQKQARASLIGYK